MSEWRRRIVQVAIACSDYCEHEDQWEEDECCGHLRVTDVEGVKVALCVLFRSSLDLSEGYPIRCEACRVAERREVDGK